MSTKQAKRLNDTWTELNHCNTVLNRAVTAGEFAKHIGVSRNTGKKRLDELVAHFAASTFTYLEKNKVVATVYQANAVGETL